MPLASEVLDIADTDLVIDAHVIAPALASGRSPLTVICLVDRSGSMAGEKVKLTMVTLRFLVSQLAATDKFGLVVWDDTGQIQFSPPALMDEKGKQSALEAITAAGQSRSNHKFKRRALARTVRGNLRPRAC